MKVKYAHLQASVVLPGIKTTEITLSANRTPGLEMDFTPQGLMLEVKDRKGMLHKGIVPSTNIKVMHLESDEEERPGKAKSRSAFAEA